MIDPFFLGLALGIGIGYLVGVFRGSAILKFMKKKQEEAKKLPKPKKDKKKKEIRH
ncbi:MAG: hypothetical protein ABIE23_04295 [archaeon]